MVPQADKMIHGACLVDTELLHMFHHISEAIQAARFDKDFRLLGSTYFAF